MVVGVGVEAGERERGLGREVKRACFKFTATRARQTDLRRPLVEGWVRGAI